MSENRTREEEDCLYWPVKYSSNEAGAGREVRQEMEKSPQENEHHSFLRHKRMREDQGGRKRRKKRNNFIVWELKSPHNSGGGFIFHL